MPRNETDFPQTLLSPEGVRVAGPANLRGQEFEDLQLRILSPGVCFLRVVRPSVVVIQSHLVVPPTRKIKILCSLVLSFGPLRSSKLSRMVSCFLRPGMVLRFLGLGIRPQD